MHFDEVCEPARHFLLLVLGFGNIKPLRSIIYFVCIAERFNLNFDNLTSNPHLLSLMFYLYVQPIILILHFCLYACITYVLYEYIL